MGRGKGPDLGGEEAEPQKMQGAGFHYSPSMPSRKQPCWGSADYSLLLSLCICDQGLSWRGDQGREVNPRNGARCPGTLRFLWGSYQPPGTTSHWVPSPPPLVMTYFPGVLCPSGKSNSSSRNPMPQKTNSHCYSEMFLR